MMLRESHGNLSGSSTQGTSVHEIGADRVERNVTRVDYTIKLRDRPFKAPQSGQKWSRAGAAVRWRRSDECICDCHVARRTWSRKIPRDLSRARDRSRRAPRADRFRPAVAWRSAGSAPQDPFGCHVSARTDPETAESGAGLVGASTVWCPGAAQHDGADVRHGGLDGACIAARPGRTARYSAHLFGSDHLCGGRV